jgi:hypothetical protein
MTTGSYVDCRSAVYIKPAAGSPSASSHVWFQDNSGNTRGIVYADNSNVIRVTAGTTTCATFTPDGATTVGLIATSAITNTNGQVRSSRAGQSVNNGLYVTSSFSAEAPDGGNPAYSFHRVGTYACSLYLGTDNQLGIIGSDSALSTVITSANQGTYFAGLGTGAIGTFAYLYNVSGSTIGEGGTLAGSGLRYSSHNAQSGTPVGTWRACGYGNTNAATVWQRIA